MTNFFNAAEDEDGAAGSAQIGREEWLRVAHEHKHSVPHRCGGGHAAHLRTCGSTPAWASTWCAFSGGKGIRGPQNAGLLLGRKHLTDLAAANNNPSDGVGRGMKVAKEQIVGMVAAVDWVLSHTEESMQGDYQKRADLIAARSRAFPPCATETVVPKIANHVPHLLIRFDPAVTGVTTSEIVAALARGHSRHRTESEHGRTSQTRAYPPTRTRWWSGYGCCSRAKTRSLAAASARPSQKRLKQLEEGRRMMEKQSRRGLLKNAAVAAVGAAGAAALAPEAQGQSQPGIVWEKRAIPRAPAATRPASQGATASCCTCCTCCGSCPEGSADVQRDRHLREPRVPCGDRGALSGNH